MVAVNIAAIADLLFNKIYLDFDEVFRSGELE
jgi:hypothetical protein